MQTAEVTPRQSSWDRQYATKTAVGTGRSDMEATQDYI